MKVELGPEYVAIVGGGDIAPASLQLVLDASSVVAADSGARFLRANDIIPWVLVGDFDSCEPEVLSYLDECGSRIITLPRDKDKTDTEVALDMALEEGFRQAVLVGGMGGTRPEHSIANLSLIEAYAEKGLDVVIHHNDSVIFGLLGREDGLPVERYFTGNKGDWVSIFPITACVQGITTYGLRFPLVDATTRRGTTLGTSNEMTGGSAAVSMKKGFLLVVLTGGSPS